MPQSLACLLELDGRKPTFIILQTEAPKSTSDAAHASRASLLKKRKMSERDAEVSDEMQVTTLMQFVDGVVDAAGLGVKLRWILPLYSYYGVVSEIRCANLTIAR